MYVKASWTLTYTHFDITNRQRKEFINYHFWYEEIDGVYVEQSDFIHENNVDENNIIMLIEMFNNIRIDFRFNLVLPFSKKFHKLR
jgi:hypothetical protein